MVTIIIQSNRNDKQLEYVTHVTDYEHTWNYLRHQMKILIAGYGYVGKALDKCLTSKQYLANAHETHIVDPKPTIILLIMIMMQ